MTLVCENSERAFTEAPDPVALNAHCNVIPTQDACDAEQRCQWVRRESSPYCRRIYCKAEGKPRPRSDWVAKRRGRQSHKRGDASNEHGFVCVVIKTV